MSIFAYKAKSGPEQVVEGLLEADSHRIAMEKLARMGYFPIRLDEQAKEHAPNTVSALFDRIPGKDLGLFTRQLADLLDSGMPLLRALKSVQQQTENKRLGRIIGEMATEIEGGIPLSESLKAHPNVFSPVYVSLIRAGESAGALAPSLSRLSEFADQEDELKAKIQTALAYPLLISVVGGGTVVFLVSTVIPRLGDIFSEMGRDLPLPTRILTGISGFLSGYGGLVLIAGIIIAALGTARRGAENGANVTRWIGRLPIWRTVAKKVSIARFARTMATLLASGVPLLDALMVARELLQDLSLKRQIDQTADHVREGMSLSESLRKMPDFPVFLCNMVAVGEEGDQLDISLQKVAIAYERDAERALKLFTSLLEPMMVLAVGGIVGLIVVAMLLPVFEIPAIVK